MPSNPIRFILPIGIIVLLGVSINVLNKGIERNAPGDPGDHDLASATGLYEPPPAPKTPQPEPNAPTAPTAPAGDPVPPEMNIGSPSAKDTVLIGWAYDETTMNHPDTLVTPVIVAAQSWAQDHKDQVHLVVEDLDIPRGLRRAPQGDTVTTLGVVVNGKSSFKVGGKVISLTGYAGENYSASDVTAALQSILP